VKLLLEEDRSLPLVQFSLVSEDGSVLDPEGKEGLMRLTTRLMRRSAGGLDANEVDERLDRMGGSLGVDVSTSAIGFSGAVLGRSLDTFVDLVGAALREPALPEAELERLKRETLAEIVEALDDDRRLARTWFRRTLFAGHAYGRGSTGTRDSILGLGPADVRWAYDRLYHESPLCLALSGDVGASEVERIALRVAPADSGKLERTARPEAPKPLSGPKLLIVDKPERTQTQILIGTLGTHASDADHTALIVANTVFGGAFSSRLMQQVRAERGWSYGAYSSLPIERARQAFSMWTFPKASEAAACLELELSMLSSWVDSGITKEELEWAKHYLVRSHVFSSDTAAKRLGLRQDELLLDLPEGYHAEFTERVASVTLAQANAAVRARISPENVLVVVLGTAPDIRQGLTLVMPKGTEVDIVAWDAP
jgi:zinc protease